jgi:hypothetical protein
MARGRKPTTGDQAMTAAERQRRRRALKQFAATTRKYSEDPRREKPVSITWNPGNLVGHIEVDGEYWGAVEWSNKHQCWCIEDSEGACLLHEDAIHGAADSRDAAVALATDMIRDGRMPTPQEAQDQAWAALPEEERARRKARAAEQERRRLREEQLAQDPVVQARRAKAQQRRDAERAAWSAEQMAQHREIAEPPLYEVLSDVFDFADPELWKSNSFAALRPRLMVHLQAVIAKLERECASAVVGSSRHRASYKLRIAENAPRLAKAREIHALLTGD